MTPGRGPAPDGRRRRLVAGAAATAATGLLGGCVIDLGDGSSTSAPPVEADGPPMGDGSGDGRVAWVFGSGGPRGFVHVGVVKGLQALGLAPDLVVGSSVGAVVAVLVAAGRSADELEAMALSVQVTDLVRLSPLGPPWLTGGGIARWVRRAVGDRPLQALPVPAAVVAVRQPGDRVVAFTQGDCGLAVQASTAIEGRLRPVTIRGTRYVDADLHRPLPVRLARSLGARHVVAVDASAHEDRAPPEAERYRESDRRKRALTAPDAHAADLLLHPDTGYWSGWSERYRRDLIAAGEAAVTQRAQALVALHARRRAVT